MNQGLKALHHVSELVEGASLHDRHADKLSLDWLKHAYMHACSCSPATSFDCALDTSYAVDALNADPSGLTPASVAGLMVLGPTSLVLGYGLARIGASFCSEARNAVFASVSITALERQGLALGQQLQD